MLTGIGAPRCWRPRIRERRHAMTVAIGAAMWLVGAFTAYRIAEHVHRLQTVRRRLYG